MLLKFTSRKVHARHVFLSSDLTELVWSVKEEGPVRKGRNKSLLLSEIDRIVVGEQPSRFHSNAGKHVSATAVRLSEKLTFRTSSVEHSALLSSTKKAVAVQNKNKKLDDELSQSQGKSSILSTLFKSKDEKDRRKSSDSNQERGSQRGSDGSVDSSMRPKHHKRDTRGSPDGRGSDVSSLDNTPPQHRNR
jgi:hypothetical protein